MLFIRFSDGVGAPLHTAMIVFSLVRTTATATSKTSKMFRTLNASEI